jgi:hypothetical protein
MWISIVLTALIAMLMVLVEHWMPWRKMIGKELPKQSAYILGTLAILGPLTVLFITWGDWQALASIWITAAAAGTGTLAAYAIDGMLDQRIRLKAIEAEHAVLKQGVKDAQDR